MTNTERKGTPRRTFCQKNPSHGITHAQEPKEFPSWDKPLNLRFIRHMYHIYTYIGGWGSESARMPPNGKFFWFLCVRDSEAGVFLVKSPPGAGADARPPLPYPIDVVPIVRCFK